MGMESMMEYLRTAWYLAAWSADVVPGRMLARTLLDRPMVFFREPNGLVHALEDRCPHRSAPLSMGRLNGDRLTCGYHGLVFDSTGACVGNPHGDGRIPRGTSVPTRTVVERHGGIWMWAGDGTPDERLIPDFSILDSEDFVTRRDHLVMDAPFDLIVDNLLDCSHTSFLHDGILGNEQMLGVRTQVVQTGTTIRVVREAASVPPPGMFDMLFGRGGQLVDTWTDFRWDAPSHLLLDVGVTAPGEDRRAGTGYFGTHVLTPETATTTHYHTAATRWGLQPGTDSDEMRLKVADLRRFAFEEQDEPMIRAQHHNLRAFAADAPRPILLETDAGVVRWHRIMEQLLDAERPSPATVPAADPR